MEIYSGGSRLTRDVWAFTKKLDRDDLFAAATWDFCSARRTGTARTCCWTIATCRTEAR